MKRNSKDRNLMRALAILMLVAVASMATHTASAREIGYLQLYSYTGEPTESGHGYVRYDRSSLDPYYELRDAWRECDKSSDPAACDGLPYWLEFNLDILDANFTWMDTVFTTNNFRWYYGAEMNGDCAQDWYGCNAYLEVTISKGPDYIWVDCYGDGQITDSGLRQDCGEYYGLDYYVGGRGGADYWDGSRFYWREATAPPSVPEPTMLALLGVGLAGIGFTRRRKAQTLSVSI